MIDGSRPGDKFRQRRRPGSDPFTVDLKTAPGGAVTSRPHRSWEVFYIVALLVADLSAVVLAVVVTWLLRSRQTNANVTVLDWKVSYLVLAAVAIPTWLASLVLARSYVRRSVGGGRGEYRRPVVCAFWLLAVASILGFATHGGLSRSVVVCFFPVLSFCELVVRYLVHQVLTAFRRRGLGLRRLLLVGDHHSVAKFAEHLVRSPRHGYRVVGACVPELDGSLQTAGDAIPVAGPPDELVGAARALEARTVAVVGPGRFENITLQQVAWQFERSGVDLLVAPDVVDLAGPRITVSPDTGLPLLHIGEPRIGGRSRILKDWFERALALPLVLLLSPVLFLGAMAVLVCSGRPVLYRQERIGYRGRPFSMLKFRTMVPDAEAMLESLRDQNDADGALFKIRGDPRTTRVGRWLRRYSIDELPQLFNVLRGNMVLVGPRPCLASEVESFGEAAHRRFLARPGLTGLWQVSGRANVSWEDAVRLDLYYVENWSPLMDLSILYRTLMAVLQGRGAY